MGGSRASRKLTTHEGLRTRITSGLPTHPPAKRCSTSGWRTICAFPETSNAHNNLPTTAHFRSAPWGAVFPLLAIVGFVGIRWFIARDQELNSFLASSCYLAGILLSVVFGIFPMVLPARNSLYSLTIENSRAATYGLKIGVIWWIFGMLSGHWIFFVRVPIVRGQSQFRQTCRRIALRDQSVNRIRQPNATTGRVSGLTLLRVQRSLN